MSTYFGTPPKPTNKTLADDLESMREREIKIEERQETLERRIEDDEKTERAENFLSAAREGRIDTAIKKEQRQNKKNAEQKEVDKEKEKAKEIDDRETAIEDEHLKEAA